jgi:HAMP domain-containing protein
MRLTDEELTTLLAEVKASGKMRDRLIRLRELREGDLTYPVCAAALGIKQEALEKSVQRMRQRWREAAEKREAEPAPPPKPKDPDEGPDYGIRYARFLLRQIEHPVSSGGIAAPEGDRDSIQGRRLTVEDVNEVVKALARVRCR